MILQICWYAICGGCITLCALLAFLVYKQIKEMQRVKFYEEQGVTALPGIERFALGNLWMVKTYKAEKELVKLANEDAIKLGLVWAFVRILNRRQLAPLITPSRLRTFFASAHSCCLWATLMSCRTCQSLRMLRWTKQASLRACSKTFLASPSYSLKETPTGKQSVKAQLTHSTKTSQS